MCDRLSLVSSGNGIILQIFVDSPVRQGCLLYMHPDRFPAQSRVQWSDMWKYLLRRRGQKDQAQYQEHLQLYRVSSYAGLITRVRQYYPHKGTKAYVQWQGTNSTSAIWVPDQKVNCGEYVVLTGNYGHGDHHDETVFYVTNLVDRFDDACYRRAHRHERRIAKAQP